MTTTTARSNSSLLLLREIVLWVAAAAGAISVIAAVAAVGLGVRPLMFMSGSMAPRIPTGSLALAQRTPSSDVHIGDVISFETSQGIRITHRVARVTTLNGRPAFITKGDANATEDVVPVVASTVDREFLTVPGLGYAVNAVLQPEWSFAGGALVGLAVAVSWLRGREPENRDDPAPSPERARFGRTLRAGPLRLARSARTAVRFLRRRVAKRPAAATRVTATMAVAVLTVLAAGVVAGPSGTAAAFTDTASNSSSPSVFTAASIPAAPTALVCSFKSSGNSATLSWTAPWGTVTSYAVSVTSGGTSVYSGSTSTPTTSFGASSAPAGTWNVTVTPTNTYGTGPALNGTATYVNRTSLTC